MLLRELTLFDSLFSSMVNKTGKVPCEKEHTTTHHIHDNIDDTKVDYDFEKYFLPPSIFFSDHYYDTELMLCSRAS